MNLTYMIHPNNHLTKLDNFTIPNMETYSQKLDEQIQTLKLTSSSKNLRIPESKSLEITKLLKYKQVERNYIVSYLKVLKLLDTVDSCCCSNQDDYDYEAEDKILDSIEIHMNEFKKNESQLKKLKLEQEGSETQIKTRSNSNGTGKDGLDGVENGIQNISINGNTQNRKSSVIKIEQDLVENVDVEEV